FGSVARGTYRWPATQIARAIRTAPPGPFLTRRRGCGHRCRRRRARRQAPRREAADRKARPATLPWLVGLAPLLGAGQTPAEVLAPASAAMPGQRWVEASIHQPTESFRFRPPQDRS